MVVNATPSPRSTTVTIPGGLNGSYYIGLLTRADASNNSIAVALPPPSPVAVSGTLRYERPAINTTTNRLDTATILSFPAGFVRVQLLDADNTPVATADADAAGNYSLSGSVRGVFKIRMIAEMIRGASPAYNVAVKNQAPGATVGSSHTVDSSSVSNACGLSCSVDLTAIDSNRGAGPFAILGTIRQSMDTILTAAPGTDFPQLHIKWRNFSNDGSYFARTASVCGTGVPNCIVLLGNRGADSDEYDQHVVAHEFMHYVEANFSRSDSRGGAHGPNDLLEPRVAYSEGMANAISGVIVGSALYVDTAAAGGFNMNLESGSHSLRGYYSEASIQSVVYDLFDANNEGLDSLSLSFTDLYAAIVALKNTDSITWIHEFIGALKTARPGDSAAIDAILTTESLATTEAGEGDVSASVSSVWTGQGIRAHSCVGSQSDFFNSPAIQVVTGSGANAFGASIGATLRASQWCGMVAPSPNKLFGSLLFRVTPDYSGFMFVSAYEISLSNGRPEIQIISRGSVVKTCLLSNDYLTCTAPVNAGQTYVLEIRMREACFLGSCTPSNSDLTQLRVRIDLPFQYAGSPTYPGSGGRFIFLTQGLYAGDFGGVAQADGVCMANIPSALTGTGRYKSLIVATGQRVATTSPDCGAGCTGRLDWVLRPNTEYYRWLGPTRVGTTTGDALFSFPLDSGLDLTGTGSSTYWTGLNRDWVSAGWTVDSHTCGGWTGSTSSGSIGQAFFTDSRVLSTGGGSCDSTLRSLICVQE
ncbi:MAG: DUF1554 domain-containing protein [bacterium]|nr:DUF1554 domain-containing protein [bacterium]